MDGFRQIGKYMDTTRKKADQAQRGKIPSLPLIERKVDGINGISPFIMSFEVPGHDNQVTIDVIFDRVFGDGTLGPTPFPTINSILIDDTDITFAVFGVLTIDPTDVSHIWRQIDISTHIKGPGYHTIKITTGGPLPGRVEVRVKIR